MCRCLNSSAPITAVAVLVAAIASVQEPDAFPPATPESQGLDGEALKQLAEVVQGYVDDEHAVGAEILVIKNRRTVLHEAFGWRDREDETPMERDTIFNIRSMTKPLTGSAIQLLAEEGRLRLDDPVAKHLASFDNETSGAITIEQLLSHRGGLPLTALSSSIDEYPDLLTLANSVGEKGPEFEPGSKFWYSDAGSDVLGAIVEVVSGEKLDEFVERRLLGPLGMADSLYIADMDDPHVARVASLYVGGGGAWSKFWGPNGGDPLYPFAWGSQTLYSTPSDYARFLAMWIDEGKWDDRPVLPREAVARVLTPRAKMKSLGTDDPYPTFFPGMEAHYGQMSIIFMEEDAEVGAKPVIIGHSGSDGTGAWAWPELDLMVLYFTQTRGGLSVLRIQDEIDRLLIHPARRETISATPVEFEPFLGPYVANFGPFRNVEFTVLVKNGNLAVDVPGQLVFELKAPDAEGKRHFVMTDEIAVSFDRDDDGAVTGMKMYQAGMTFELPKGEAPDEPEPALDLELAKRLVGTYRDEENERDIEVLIQNERLAIRVPEQPMPLELYAPDEDGLWALRLNASVRLRFNEDENGRIVSFSAIMPDGTEEVRPRVLDG